MIQGVRRRLAVLALVSLVSLALIALAWPRFLASVRYLPVEGALSEYHADNVIPSDRLKVLIRFAEEAIGLHDHYRYHNGLSLLHYLRGLDVETPARERRDAYRNAEAAAMDSLRQAPAQSALWLQLAMVRWILHDEPEAIIEPWKMSVFTGRTHSSLYTQRVEIGLRFRSYLDDEGLAMLRDQLRLAWNTRPGALAQLLGRRDPDLRLVRYILEGAEPVMLEELESWLERLR